MDHTAGVGSSPQRVDARHGELPGPVPGRLVGRERHVLAEVDGTVASAPWLDGLEVQRRWAAELAADVTTPRVRSLPHGAGVAGRALLVAMAGALGGSNAAAPRLRRLLLAQGPTFAKFGQLISGGGGLFPDRLVAEFEGFRDRLPAEPWSHVRQVLTEDLPGGENAFAWIDHDPLAAASIAQVHAATLADGREVVVKVQRPGITERCRRDLTWLATAAAAIDKTVPPARSGNLPGIISYFADTLAEELDFRLEAENMLDVAEAVSRSAKGSQVAVPRPHATLVTRRVLVMERFRGFASTDSAGIAAAGIDTAAMLSAGFEAFVEGAVRHGVFHGDLHPGNVMVLPDGRYGILDYGIVGRLTAVERRAFAQMMVAGAMEDVAGQLAAFDALGAFPPGADVAAFAAELPSGVLPGGAMPDLREMSASMSANVGLMRKHRFRLPTLLVLLSKNLIFAGDAIARYAPGTDLVTDALPLFAAALNDASGDHPAPSPSTV